MRTFYTFLYEISSLYLHKSNFRNRFTQKHVRHHLFTTACDCRTLYYRLDYFYPLRQQLTLPARVEEYQIDLINFSLLARPTAELDRPRTRRSGAQTRHELALCGRSAHVRRALASGGNMRTIIVRELSLCTF